MKKLDYKDLYFGVTYPDWNGKLKTYNIFDSVRVLRSIYAYRKHQKLHPEYLKNIRDPLHYCFGDLQGRVEWEMIVLGMGKDGNATKIDVYNMFVVPNRKILLNLVEQVTMTSLKREMKKLGF